MVRRVWGTPREAEEAGEWMARTGMVLENIHASDRIIWLKVRAAEAPDTTAPSHELH
jgi:hypothetical protein